MGNTSSTTNKNANKEFSNFYQVIDYNTFAINGYARCKISQPGYGVVYNNIIYELKCINLVM